MTRSKARARSGITLVEILISIMILGIGVVSIATLFPLGLIRLRNAQRLTRGAFMVESAIADMGAKNLFYKPKFTNPVNSPWYQDSGFFSYDPWTQDTVNYGALWNTATGANHPVGPALPIAYDPLWHAVTGVYPDPTVGATNIPNRIAEARFANGQGWLRHDPDGLGAPGGTPSAHGLQRLTNYISYIGATGSPLRNTIALGGTTGISDFAFVHNNGAVIETFVSPEDVVLQDPKGVYANVIGTPSPIVPDLNTGAPVNDWRFTWFATGQQSDVTDGSVFDFDIVVCENRPFGIDLVTTPYAGPGYQITGETVVEAVWGYSSTGSGFGYGTRSASRSVLLRWPASMPDPEVKVGGWIADVTYERNQGVVNAGRFPNLYPAQRCYWYQLAKKSEVAADPGLAGDIGPYRRMTVWTSAPLRALSLLNFSATPAIPVHVEAALIMPSVINVYPRTIYARPTP